MTGSRYSLFGVCVDTLDRAETLSRCEELVEQRRFAQHVVLNAGKVVMMHDDPALARIVSECDLVNADGMSVVWAGRLLGVPFPERVAGIDLMCDLLALCAERQWPVYFLGAREDVLSDFLQTAARTWPGLKVAGSHHGYFNDDGLMADSIRESGARLLVVGISSPRKERFLAEQRERLGQLLAMGVGGSLDVISGHTRRAPLWMQRGGLEWAYRFGQEPRRMWRRYLVGNARFVGLVLREAVRRAAREAPRVARKVK